MDPQPDALLLRVLVRDVATGALGSLTIPLKNTRCEIASARACADGRPPRPPAPVSGTVVLLTRCEASSYGFSHAPMAGRVPCRHLLPQKSRPPFAGIGTPAPKAFEPSCNW